MADLHDQRPESTIRSPSPVLEGFRQTWRSLPQGKSLPAETWARRHRAITRVLWLHVVAIPLFAWFQDYSALHALLEAAPVAAAAVAARFVRGRRAATMIASVGLVSCSAILVHISGGVIEMHFHFFVMLGIIALYQDWRPFLLAMAYVVIHHTLLGALDPGSVYNHPAAVNTPWKWALIHGFFVAGVGLANLIAWRTAEDARDEAELILTSAGEGIFGLDLKGRATFTNQAATRMIARDANALSGQSMHDLVHHSHPDGSPYPGNECPIYAVLRDGVPRHVDDEVFWRADGSSFPVDYTSTPIWRRGRVVGAVVTFQDITERKSLEAQVRQAQKMEAVGQLAGGVAHDFNNLIGVIQNYAAFVAEDLDQTDPRREDVQEIRDAATRAAGLTRQLLAFSRKEVIRPEIIDLNEAIANVNKLLARTIGEEIELHVGLAPDLWHTTIDRGQLEQVVLNLAINSRDAMSGGGGKLFVETANCEVDSGSAAAHPGLRPGRYVCLTVRDTGRGMSKEVLNRIFEPFFTTKGRGAGTGLGLSTVYGIVKQAEGYVLAESEPGRGATFTIYLPVTDAIAEHHGAGPEPGRENARAATILVAEDEPGIRRIAERILSGAGFHVLAAASGSEALELTRRHGDDIDVLLTDVVMPQMSGVELADRLKHDHPRLESIFMSGYPDAMLSERGVLEDKHRYLHKPFTSADLLSEIERALDVALSV
jgi:two-component system, cell cycle sensor histidine kinase and response regulator CckA